MTLQFRIVAYCNHRRGIIALNGLLYHSAAWTQLKDPLLTQLSSSFITVHSVLHLQKLPNTTGDKTTMGDHFFSKRRVSEISFKNNDTSVLHVIEPQASVGKYIKSDKIGEVSLGLENDCGCWIRIKATSSGK